MITHCLREFLRFLHTVPHSISVLIVTSLASHARTTLFEKVTQSFLARETYVCCRKSPSSSASSTYHVGYISPRAKNPGREKCGLPLNSQDSLRVAVPIPRGKTFFLVGWARQHAGYSQDSTSDLPASLHANSRNQKGK